MDALSDALTADAAAGPRRRRLRGSGPRDEPALGTEVEAEAGVDATHARDRFLRWFRSRPTIGGLLTVIGGAAMFWSTQLELGGMTVHVGIEGAQAMILPAVLIVCGVLAILSPGQHVFYGIVALIISVYSLVGVNLGGFFLGFLLGSVGGVVVVSWRQKKADATALASTGEHA
ncbi:hypothetical protein FLP10_14135 [Agromyces intestinalis]|uniref:Uncharacterized protein n=1 Tax=Agromyces intestinalis TaxID=2592652 RepID=A0A5C1YJJ5_9MICO|nr:DUF6114 domain-containing protein [Agromyces intestinalis]QEO15440.1 hypothetical protein FLP10_14135 [Agromyces intestinalis]